MKFSWHAAQVTHSVSGTQPVTAEREENVSNGNPGNKEGRGRERNGKNEKR